MRAILVCCAILGVHCGSSSGGSYICSDEDFGGTREVTIRGRGDCSFLDDQYIVRSDQMSLGDCETDVTEIDACTREQLQACQYPDGTSTESLSVWMATGPGEGEAVLTIRAFDAGGNLVDICTADATYERL